MINFFLFVCIIAKSQILYAPTTELEASEAAQRAAILQDSEVKLKIIHEGFSSPQPPTSGLRPNKTVSFSPEVKESPEGRPPVKKDTRTSVDRAIKRELRDRAKAAEREKASLLAAWRSGDLSDDSLDGSPRNPLPMGDFPLSELGREPSGRTLVGLPPVAGASPAFAQARSGLGLFGRSQPPVSVQASPVPSAGERWSSRGILRSQLQPGQTRFPPVSGSTGTVGTFTREDSRPSGRRRANGTGGS